MYSSLPLMLSEDTFVAFVDYTGHINSSLLAEAITSCLEELSEPLVTSQLSGDLLAHLSAVSEGSVKMYVVKCLLEQLPEQHHGGHSVLYPLMLLQRCIYYQKSICI